ncbi:uncharacterized protein F5891DRAFT_42829 [Suillus fuscotomentosus]|uniref:YCII-related domain-containing protein n=1 Tax=Suillus fuscotomentosus TaxID=1912939 RepID=A0AAD4HR14_9AGAM|nr:uncharacterized protein F5891DRAFT_42829 [Suillus fuscotomentosus]KAG1904379.1 hypothetical protein F5891DRAFT_42829 [Suillus fuscotomentosus]
MSSTPSLLNFVVWAPDYTDEGALERRLAVRPAHLENAKKLINQGILRVGGGLLTPESVNAAAADIKFVGSCLIYEGETIDAVRKIVEEDLYYTADVWDKEKIVILPIALATGLPPVPS